MPAPSWGDPHALRVVSTPAIGLERREEDRRWREGEAQDGAKAVRTAVAGGTTKAGIGGLHEAGLGLSAIEVAAEGVKRGQPAISRGLGEVAHAPSLQPRRLRAQGVGASCGLDWGENHSDCQRHR